MTHRRGLRADCAACQGLCCVALGFEKSEWFAFDKPAQEPCPQLEPQGTCAIHDDLVAEGLSGCAHYDCYGAGQAACRSFEGRSFRDGPEAAARIFDAFARLREIHELRYLLHEAGRLALEARHEAERRALLAELEPAASFTPAALSSFDLNGVGARTKALLRRLSVYFPGGPTPRRLRVLRAQRAT